MVAGMDPQEVSIYGRKLFPVLRFLSEYAALGGRIPLSQRQKQPLLYLPEFCLPALKSSLMISRVQTELVLRSQFVILKKGNNIKHLPYAFTEQGVAILSGILRSDRAIQANVVEGIYQKSCTHAYVIIS